MQRAILTKTSNNGYAMHANPFSRLYVCRRPIALSRGWRLAFFINWQAFTFHTNLATLYSQRLPWPGRGERYKVERADGSGSAILFWMSRAFIREDVPRPKIVKVVGKLLKKGCNEIAPRPSHTSWAGLLTGLGPVSDRVGQIFSRRGRP